MLIENAIFNATDFSHTDAPGSNVPLKGDTDTDLDLKQIFGTLYCMLGLLSS